MRILHVVPTYLPAVRYGGPIQSVHGLAAGQAALGHAVEVFTTNVDGPTNSAVPVGVPIDVDGVRVTYYETGVGRKLYRSPDMGKALGDCVDTFDIVHLHSVFLWPTLAGARIAAARRVPFVLSPRGMLVSDLIRRKSAFLKTGWIELFERDTIRDAAALHVTAANEADDLKPFGFSLPPVWVVANGVHLPARSHDAEAVSEDVRNAIAAGPYILALGRINWKKNLVALVEAMAMVPDQRCIIAGNAEDDHASDLRRRIAELGVADRLVILDRQIEDADKSLLYQCCSLFVIPSLHENFGNVALEAMASSKAVVVSSGAGVAALIAEAGAGVVVAPRADAISDAVSRLAASPTWREACGRAGRRVVEERYGWHRIAGEMVTHYGTVVDRGLRP